MDRTADLPLNDLRHLINDLGKDGGLMGPSVYDTAQVLRMAPPAEGVRPALEWLLTRQHTDGGWGNPAVPRSRDVPTLAAILALHTYNASERDRQAIQAGLAFLQRQAEHWAGGLPDDLPVGVELILPQLLDEAAAAGLKVSREPYQALIALGMRRRRMLASLPLQPGTTPVHAWEAWGRGPDPALLDAPGSIGHSPAATAAWLRAAVQRADLADACAMAQRYLEQAAASTGTGIPGVVPTAWPITRFEQAFSLYALLIGGLMDHPALDDVVRAQVDGLARALRPEGLGFSDFFIPDGDDTAEALAVLSATGRPADRGILKRFAQDDHFYTYPGELQPSITATAHAIHALALSGEACERPLEYLVERQLPDGRWPGDKWNGSWLYATCQVVIALLGSPYQGALRRAVDALLAHQHADGGWGMYTSTAEETAYGIFILRHLLRDGLLDPAACQALRRAERWMLNDYQTSRAREDICWLAKELYRPYRLARVIELVATVPCVEAA